jgi:molybdopterin synthase catalytic subunit
MGAVRVQREDFDIAAEARALIGGRSDVGALASFVGLCRDEGGRLSALEIEHYPGMAEREIAAVVAEAEARWPLLGVCVIHRYGEISPGEQIVYVGVAAAHRAEAFAAAEMLMDYLKTRAPFWKRARLADGTSEDWVEPKGSDDASAERWDTPAPSVKRAR